MRHTPDEIDRKAQELLRESGALSVPTDLERVLGYLNTKVHHEELESDVSGVLIVKGEQRHILVNKDHPANRTRFTIAHEIGHLLLHDDVGEDGGDQRMHIDRQIRVYQRVGAASSTVYDQAESLTDAQMEREANNFAACLLMPGHRVIRAAMERDLFDELSVASLARKFGVSEQAMSIRLQQLKLLELNIGA